MDDATSGRRASRNVVAWTGRTCNDDRAWPVAARERARVRPAAGGGGRRTVRAGRCRIADRVRNGVLVTRQQATKRRGAPPAPRGGCNFIHACSPKPCASPSAATYAHCLRYEYPKKVPHGYTLSS
jgi:hypothetical protein